ncbi:amino acid adenylation domain-containing protein [Dyella acidiphila]|uniref:Amino acid adenylation domain-containing protein n=1 Tax=Dyella acidiphila TaxID=2775866 RepID=A0ABR9GDC0_9GAMM|nr:amino acid adenylation domain-containing protein [Dyella acidiphila]MBE1162040.1 amino acid adenylation domain-containing protein [Dyella acidiphila]
MPTLNVLSQFCAMAGRFADTLAIEYDTFEDDLPARPGITYAELEQRSNQLARCLLHEGVAPGMPVAILAEDAGIVVTAMLAVLKAGAAFVPLDPRLPAPRMAAMLALAQPVLVLAESEAVAAWAQLDPSVSPRPPVLALDSVDELRKHLLDWPLRSANWRHKSTAACQLPMDADAFCYIFFTSGSTGEPKAIAGRFQGIGHFIQWEIDTFGITPGTRVSQLTTPSFDAFLRDVFTPLCAGGTICVPNDRKRVMVPGELAAWLELRGIQLMHCVPTVFRLLLEDPGPADALPDLRWILLAGETVTPNDVMRWTQLFGTRIRLANLYGPSETTMTKFCHLIDADDGLRRTVPIGHPIPGASAMVVDGHDQLCTPGTVGEILIRTPYRTLGYYRRPDLTAAAFVPNPFALDNEEDLVYRTGDLGRELPDGSFELAGRRDSQVKIRGVRVEPSEIEDRLRCMPGVADAAVIARNDRDGGASLHAYVVAHGEPPVAALRRWVAQALPEVMIPASFTLLAALPRTLSGKVDRQLLSAAAAPQHAPLPG